MPTSGRPPRQRRYQLAYDLHPNLRQRKYYYYNFMTGAFPIVYTNGATGVTTLQASPTTVNTVSKVLIPGSTLLWDYYSTTAQSSILVSTAGSGLEISGDETDNEALELVPGEIAANNPLAMTVGTDSDFFFKAKFKFTDADGSDQFGIGWRKNEAGTAATSFLSGGDALYTDFVLFGFAGTVANPNPLRVSTDVGNSGTATVTTISGAGATGFTWADAAVHTLEVRVVGRRAIFLINGVRAGNPVTKDGNGTAIATAIETLSGPAYDFTSGLTLIPFIFLRQDAAVANDTYLQEVEIGHLVDVGLDPNAE